MNVDVIIQKVSNLSEDKFSIKAEDPTHGIMHFGLEKKYGTPKAGDVITLHYQPHSCSRIAGMDLNGQPLYRN